MKKPFNKSFIVVVAYVFYCGYAIGQNKQKFFNGDPVNAIMSQLVEPTSTSKWLYFKTTANISGATIFQTQKDAFDLKINDEIRLTKQETDDAGITHYFFQQFYKNIPVEDGKYMVHERNGRAISANGILVLNMNAQDVALLSESQALQAALNHMNASVYGWQNEQEEMLLQKVKNDSTATYYPKGELLLTLISDTLKNPYKNNLNAENYVLAYKFKIYATLPYITHLTHKSDSMSAFKR